EVDGSDRNFFDNIHFNQCDGTAANLPKLLINATADRNVFNNMNFDGERSDHDIEIMGTENILSNVSLVNQGAITATNQSVLISGNYNHLT
ncbi:unnamed protein product, partial [marine sediment metagenome]